MKTHLTAVLIGLIASAPAAHAGSCAVRQQVVVQKAVAYDYAPVQAAYIAVLPVALAPAAVYTVGAAYAAQPAPVIAAPQASQPQQLQAGGDKLDLILAELTAMKREIAVLKGQAPPGVEQLQAPKQVPKHPVVNDCYRCHAPGVSAEKGGQLTLFIETDGKAFPTKLPKSMAQVLRDKILKGEMPPPETGIRYTAEQRAEALKSFGIE